MTPSVLSAPTMNFANPRFGATGAEVKRVFDLLKCSAIRYNGSHCIMQAPSGHTLPPIPMHGKKDLSVGVMGSLANALGVSKQQLEAWVARPKELKQAIRSGQLMDLLVAESAAKNGGRLDRRA